MSESTEQKIEEINRKIATLKLERDQLNHEARTWAEKRNTIHEQIRMLREEAKNLREKRDATNQKVRELKNLREQSRTERKEKLAQLSKTKEKMRALMGKETPRHLSAIQKDIEDIDWKIQTTPLSLKAEKDLVDKVRTLEKQKLMGKRLQDLKDAAIKLESEERDLETRARLSHQKIEELAEQSQRFHEQIVDPLAKAQALKVEADNAHQRHVELRQKANEAHQKYVILLQQIGSLRQEVRKNDEEQQTKRQQKLLEDVTKGAKEKMKRGEKLTWDEFKLLTEQEPTTEP